MRLVWPGMSIIVFAIGGCRSNPNFCAANPGDNCDLSWDAATSAACTSDEQCAAPAAVCDVSGSMTCVPCTSERPEACRGATPTCGDDQTCRPCAAHAECASGACLPDGSCAAEDEVAHVSPDGTDNTTCTMAAPCLAVGAALATERPYVKFAGTTDASAGVIVGGGRQVTFLADPDAKLTRSSGGAIVTVEDDGTSLRVFDLAISDAPNSASGFGIVIPAASGAPSVTLTRVTLSNNPAGAISCSGGALTVARSTISNNQGGGIAVTSGTFAIVGNVLFGNGSTSSIVGGISVAAPQHPANRVEFNSLHANQAQNGLGAAIHCVAGTFTARNNIMSENGTLSNMEQVGGTCAHAYSIVRPGTIPAGPGNSALDPGFEDPASGDLHVRAGSPALGAADPGSALEGPAELDLDGDRRTAPADLGSDEVP